MYGSEDPARALAAIGELAADALYVLKDFGPHLADARAVARLPRAARALRPPARMSTVVLVGRRRELPLRGRAQVVRYDLRFPSRDEYRRTDAVV